MSDLFTEAFKSLAPWQFIQAAVAALIFYAGYRLIQRGEKDKKPNGNGNGALPSWAMMGPIHDVIGAVHEMNEQSRKQIDLLERIEAGVLASKATLEMIRNESRLR